MRDFPVRTPFRFRHPLLLVISLGSISFLSTEKESRAAATPPGAPARPSVPTAAPAPPAPGAKPASAAPATPTPPTVPAGLRIVTQQGEVLLDKGGNGAETTAPLQPTVVLAIHDEVSTNHGSIDLANATGATFRLSGASLVSLLSCNALYLARGELHVTQHAAAPPAPTPWAFTVATPCGRSLVKSGEARLRIDGNATVVSVYEGTVLLGGSTPVQAGQSARCIKGQPIAAPRPLLAAPTWPAESELVVIGDASAPTKVNLQWQAAAKEPRYRIDLLRSEGDAEVPVSSTEATAPRWPLELRDLKVGTYVTRVYAIDDNGALGQPSLPHRLLVVRIGGLGADGTARTAAGVMPRVSAPPGLTWSVLLDGAPPTADALAPGAHKLQMQISGLSADLPLVVASKAPAPLPPPPKPRPPVTDFQGDSTAVWIGATADDPASPEPVATATPESPAAKAAPPAEPKDKPPSEPNPYAAGPDDVLLGGVGEIPFDGIRSPWAGSYLGGRIESTVSGSLRLVVGGRWTMRSGFGFDVSASLLRAAVDNLPAGQSDAGIGNINVGLRTPALRSRYIALQGVAGVVAPLSTSFLDTSIEQDPRAGSTSSSVFQSDARPRGGGWRVEPALLVGVHVRNVTISTMQGISLRITPDVSAAYAGGLLVHTEIVPALRFVTFAMWEVHYLGSTTSATASTTYVTPDSAAAVGGGLEALIPAGSRGKLRLSVLGRVGIGDGGEAIYGRGTLGFQFGYLFN